jgi:DNA topoisomerase-1
VRLVVEREREIRAFIPDEYWAVEASSPPNSPRPRASPSRLERPAERARDEKGNPPTIKRRRSAWLGEHAGFRAELVEVGARSLTSQCTSTTSRAGPPPTDQSSPRAKRSLQDRRPRLAAETPHSRACAGEGPRRSRRQGPRAAHSGPHHPRRSSIRRRPTRSSRSRRAHELRPTPPFITSTLQQAARSRLGFGAQRTMRAAQQLYEGVDIPGEGPVGPHHLHAYRLDAPLQGRARHGAHLHQEDLRRRTSPRSPTSTPAATRTLRRPTRPSARRRSIYSPSPRSSFVLSPDQFKLYTSSGSVSSPAR